MRYEMRRRGGESAVVSRVIQAGYLHTHGITTGVGVYGEERLFEGIA